MNALLRFALIGLALIAIVSTYVRSLPMDIVPIGQPVRQDDFTYTVTRILKERNADTVSYVVAIRVNNDAKRVDYRWSDDAVFVADAAGRRYRAASSTTLAADRAPIPPGASAAYDLTFRLPADAKNPMLRYWNGILMGDVFDGLAYARTAVAL
jgi:uncharacterized protein DUF4352